VAGTTGLGSVDVTILNAPKPNNAVRSDRKGVFRIRRTDSVPTTACCGSASSTARRARRPRLWRIAGRRGVRGRRARRALRVRREASVRRASAGRREIPGRTAARVPPGHQALPVRRGS
jgi:hypothetical protein